MAEPSVRVPVLVTLTPLGAASRVTVRFFTGQGAGVYLLFAILAFQVPRELSAPCADAVRVIAETSNARVSNFRISILLNSLSQKLRLVSVSFRSARSAPV